MRLVPLLALCLAAPLAAQTPDPTPPERYYPLGVGDIREYRTTTGSPPRPPSFHRELVVGREVVDGHSYAVVDAIDYDQVGTETFRNRRLLRFDTTLAVPVERYPSGGEGPIVTCRLDLPFSPLGSVSDCPWYEGLPSEFVLGRPTSVKRFGNLIGDVRYAAGLGFYEQNIDEAGTESTTRLRYARIDGVAYGTPDPILPPLAPEPSAYWPLDLGNTWITRHEGQFPRYGWQRVIGTTAVADTTYSVVEICGLDLMSGARTCLPMPQRLRVDNRTGEIRQRLGYRDQPVMCGLLPTATSGPITCDLSAGGQEVELTVTGPTSVQIGPDLLPSASVRTMETSTGLRRFAAGIGPLGDSTQTLQGTLVYARIGGVEYGVNPVSGEAAPSAPALALRVAPTPTDGPVTIAVAGAASPVTVEAFDALGRRVWHAPVAGETAVDASGWAPGVYVVRATAAGGATASARIVRR